MRGTTPAAGAGYSGTPLAKKIGIKPGHRVVLTHAPAGWSIPGLPPDAAVSGGAGEHSDAGQDRDAGQHGGAVGTVGAPDITVAFFRSRHELQRDVPGLVAALRPGGALWVAWPRRAAGHVSDITENGLREVLLPHGVVDVKVAALDHDWSGLKFVWRKSPKG